MQITFAIEASQPGGTTFRIAIGISVPAGLVWTLIQLVGLS